MNSSDKSGGYGYRNRVSSFRKVSLAESWAVRLAMLGLVYICGLADHAKAELPANRWTLLKTDPTGARRGSAIRYAPNAKAFFLWGFMNDDPELLQEQPLMRVPEYDMVAFDPKVGEWRSQIPLEWQELWSRSLPLAYVPRTYAGITTGSERTVLRGPTSEKGGAPRPDLNIVFDQVTFHSPSGSLVYFTGGLTAAYDVQRRHWSDLGPSQSPPPVLGGSLAYDPLNGEIVLFGGGHVAEPTPDGQLVGYTGTWAYRFSENTWRQLTLPLQPPPRMNTRMVCDTKNQVMVLFGGDAQSDYLADTWIFDLKTRRWRASSAQSGPPARAGHFTVYDPTTGWVIVGGGYNRSDLTDMWAYEAGSDRWIRLQGEVPTGFYISADVAADQRLIVLATNTRKPDDGMDCNILYPVRTTYGYRIEASSIVWEGQSGVPAKSVAKREPGNEMLRPRTKEDLGAWDRHLTGLPLNQWVHLAHPLRAAPTRTWGSATFDTDRGQILYWGGEHCGYEGNDVDAYEVSAHTWRSLGVAEYPERLWNHGVRLAGVTFSGGPWTEHGRRIYAYDPVSRKLIMVRRIRLTAGYEPQLLRPFPLVVTSDYQSKVDTLVNPPSSCVKYVTWSFDLERGVWQMVGPAPEGLDALLSTPKGVMGVNVNWPSRLNDAGYRLPWKPSQVPEDKALFLFTPSERKWVRLTDGQPSPQNLYEQTSLAYDPKRDQVLLHGGGLRRDELWVADLASRRWKKLEPQIVGPSNGQPPECAREAVLLPKEDTFLAYANAKGESKRWELWAYRIGANSWQALTPSAAPETQLPERVGQNVAMVYDPKHDLVLLVVGERGDDGKASVYALRYHNGVAGAGN